MQKLIAVRLPHVTLLALLDWCGLAKINPSKSPRGETSHYIHLDGLVLWTL